MSKLYVSADGEYLGSWRSNPPPGSIEVPSAPEDPRQIYDHDTGDYLPPPLTLEQAEMRARARATALLTTGEATPVDVNGVFWQGGYDDVQRLDGARRLAIEAGLDEVTFYDVNNIGHTMAIADATALVIQLGARVQQLIAVKQAAYQQIDAIIADSAPSDADKVAALEALA